MARLKLKGKELKAMGFPEGAWIGEAMKTAERLWTHKEKQQAFERLSALAHDPQGFINDPELGHIAMLLIPEEDTTTKLLAEQVPVEVFGKEFIEPGAFAQMNIASRLPVAVSGALMPDAHQGYGLPIGGVLATEDAVIPYAVGVDIGCRMCLSVFDIPVQHLKNERSRFAHILETSTLFGAGKEFSSPEDHDVLYNKAFNEISMLGPLRQKAVKQAGSSGSGNHFVEFGEVEIHAGNDLGLSPGRYTGLLSHSGSRALGAGIASHYTRVAAKKRRLPKEATHLAWLMLNEEEGAEYWEAMNLAGEYASACHHIIHNKIAKALGVTPLRMIENHHNFAWKEIHGNKEVIVHRKGATPAAPGVFGIIPGSMTAPGFIVSGKGHEGSLHSASHGAGRRMSRNQALATFSINMLRDVLKQNDVMLIGGGMDESPMAYKDIEDVMQAQQDLVKVEGKFFPSIVRMDDAAPRKRASRK